MGMNQQQALKRLKSLANGRYHSIGLSTSFPPEHEPTKEYSMYIQGKKFVYGKSYEECLMKLGYKEL